MDWTYLRKQVLWGSALAAAVSLLIAAISPVPLLLALPILVFNWPITDIIIERIASRNPDADKRVVVRSWWPPALTAAIILVVTALVWRFARIPAGHAFAYATLTLTTAGAVLGIISEVEDNAPGGWLNRKPPEP